MVPPAAGGATAPLAPVHGVQASAGRQATQLIDASARDGIDADSIGLPAAGCRPGHGLTVVRLAAQATSTVNAGTPGSITMLMDNGTADPAVAQAHAFAVKVSRERLAIVAGRLQACGVLHPEMSTRLVAVILGTTSDMPPGSRSATSGEAGSARRHPPALRGIGRTARAAGAARRAFHAGLPAAERPATQDAFLAGTLEVVVATSAFGLGIDKSNVRSVVHASAPGSLDEYYQEVGRVGRDGSPARAVLVFNPSDLRLPRLLRRRRSGPRFLRWLQRWPC